MTQCKLVIFCKGTREAEYVEFFEAVSRIMADQYQSDLWNVKCAWGDRFISKLYIRSASHRWELTSQINW